MGKPYETPYQIYMQAETFYYAALTLGTESYLNQDEKFFLRKLFVTFTNHAFALELYLKCVYCIENKELIYGHNLVKLFEKLKPETQEKILANYDEIAKKTGGKAVIESINPDAKTDFMTYLHENSNAFEEFRYFFENPTKFNYNLSDAIKAVRKYILQLHPNSPTLDKRPY